MVLVSQEENELLPEHCDFCWKKRGDDGRYLVHNSSRTESICNYCIRDLFKRIGEIELLLSTPKGPAN